MIGADAAHTVTYMCELFCRWLTLRAHHFAASDGRRTLQLHDLVAGIISCDQLDFLCDIVHEHGNVDKEYERQQQIELEARLRLSRSKDPKANLRASVSKFSATTASSGSIGSDVMGGYEREEECNNQIASLNDADIDCLIGAVEARSACRSNRVTAPTKMAQLRGNKEGQAPSKTLSQFSTLGGDDAHAAADAMMSEEMDCDRIRRDSSSAGIPHELEFAPLNENELESSDLTPDIADLPAEWSGIFAHGSTV